MGVDQVYSILFISMRRIVRWASQKRNGSTQLISSLIQVSLIIMSLDLWAAPPPNIILIMSDDQGWGDVGYRNHPELKTPALDSMAANGLVFNRFYSAAPVCSPTRGSTAHRPAPLSLRYLLRQRGPPAG